MGIAPIEAPILSDLEVTSQWIKNSFAQSEVVYTRGEHLFFLGNYSLESENGDRYRYTFNGNHGDYTVTVTLGSKKPSVACTCPFPYPGCKHGVAALLDIKKRRERRWSSGNKEFSDAPYLTPEEIRQLALEGRKERAKKEEFTLIPGETFKGEHTVLTPKGKKYTVTFYDPLQGKGHCTCPDFRTNSLDLCKHLIFAEGELKKSPNFNVQVAQEWFPFVHIAWSSLHENPVCYYEKIEDPELEKRIGSLFSDKGVYTRTSMGPLFKLYEELDEASPVRFDEYLLRRMEDSMYQRELEKLAKKTPLDFSFLKATLYPYQVNGVKFAAFKKSAIIADEMGLGKTIQAIAVAILKAELFGFTKVLVVTPASLKEQWKREIEKFTKEKAVVIGGTRENRRRVIEEHPGLFKITNYEAVLRDVTILSRWMPDFIILDEAQRIKNFESKTHQAILSIPHTQSLVITGTPLENKLEDVYSIAQFSDPTLFTPLWAFAANYYNLDKGGKKIVGYRNLDVIRDKLKSLVIRRKKEEVFTELPEQIENTYYLDMSSEQEEIHQGYLSALLPLLNKKVLTPMDIKRIQMILLSMRMVCDSTYLIDKQTNLSPKLVELVPILQELVIENRRKTIIFSEWTTMTYLIGKLLSDMGIPFVQFHGKIPQEKRQLLVTEFQENNECMVFLSTDAGGTGLNLQNADCVINFDLPWNPAKLNQRIGRVNRIGQKSRTINVINLVMKNSIEMNVLAAINLKENLFEAVLEDGSDEVDFSAKSKDRFISSIRTLFDEKSNFTVTAASPSELDESTPQYLNPRVLGDEQKEIDLTVEEDSFDPPETPGMEGPSPVPSGFPLESPGVGNTPGSPGRAVEGLNSVEAMETLLTHGMAFLNSLAMMTTGKPLSSPSDGPAVSVDKETGELVLRFKLPKV